MADKTEDTYIYSVDWSDIPAGIRLGEYCGKYRFSLRASQTYSCETEMAGERRMSPKQRDVLTRMNEARAKAVHDKVKSDIRTIVDALEVELNSIRHDNTRNHKVRRKSAHVACEKATDEIESIFVTAFERLHEIVTKNIEGYVKGKHHFKKKVRQVVKHTIAVPVAVAAVPIGIVLTATGFAAPVGILAIASAAGTIKAAVDYTRNHMEGMKGLAVRIEQNLAFVVPTATAFADAAERLESFPEDEDARKLLQLQKEVIRDREICSYAVDKFMNIHARSIHTLDDLVDKYRKKINKHKYEAVKMGREIEKLEEAIDGVTRTMTSRKRELNVLRQRLGVANTETFKNSLKGIEASLAKATQEHRVLEGSARDLNQALTAEITMVANAEAAFEGWSAQVETFKAQRPKSVHTWKKIIKGLALAKLVTEIGVGGASSAVEGVTKVPAILQTSAESLKSAYDVVHDNHEDIRKGLKMADAF